MNATDYKHIQGWCGNSNSLSNQANARGATQAQGICLQPSERARSVQPVLNLAKDKHCQLIVGNSR